MTWDEFSSIVRKLALPFTFHFPPSSLMLCETFHPGPSPTLAISSGVATATQNLRLLIGNAPTGSSSRSQRFATPTAHQSVVSLTCSETHSLSKQCSQAFR